MKPAKSFLALTLVIFSLLLMACSNRQEPSSRAANANTAANANSTLPPPPPPPTSAKVNPERLIDLIKELQKEYVKESFGLESGQCFTDVDRNKFMRDGRPAEIVQRLKKDEDFRAVADAIRDMRPEDRSPLLDKARKSYKKTWAELRLDPATTSSDELRKGQTDAGQKAERLIAQAVVDLVIKMI